MADEGAAPPADGQHPKAKRKECERCSRPRSVCLCGSLPAEPLLTQGRIILLQHPIEAKRRLTTVPLLRLCLDDCHVIVGRKYKPGVHEDITEALAGATRGDYPLLLLFPGEGSQNVSDAAAALGLDEQTPPEAGDSGAGAGPARADGAAAPAGGGAAGPGRRPAYVLMVIDGTWQQAKEMFKVLAPVMLPPHGPALRVQLALPPPAGAQLPLGDVPAGAAGEEDGDGEQQSGSGGQQGGPGGQAPAEGSCLLRKEPAVGCVTTCEAVAQALGALEGRAVRAAVMAPLQALAAQQARWNPSLRARLEGVPEAAYTTSKRRFRMGSGTVPG